MPKSLGQRRGLSEYSTRPVAGDIIQGFFARPTKCKEDPLKDKSRSGNSVSVRTLSYCFSIIPNPVLVDEAGRGRNTTSQGLPKQSNEILEMAGIDDESELTKE